MRGRTLNDAFIILDESQNTTVEQMKMFLTRIGFNSRAVITGDVTQIDLPRGAKSGLRHAIEVLTKSMRSALTSSKLTMWCATQWLLVSLTLMKSGKRKIKRAQRV